MCSVQLSGTNRPPVELVELVALLERTLAYAHTGNAKVLSRGLMRRLWLLTSLLEQGLPVLAPEVKIHLGSTYPVSLYLKYWPTNENGIPLCASTKVQELTYGEQHYQVSFNSLFFILPCVNLF